MIASEDMDAWGVSEYISNLIYCCQVRVEVANRIFSCQNVISCAAHSEPRCEEEARKNSICYALLTYERS